MLWVWIRRSFIQFLRTVGWLVIPPPPSYKPPVPHRVVNSNADCPACGNSSGKIECVPHFDAQTPGLVIRHTCSICHAIWHEPTVVKDDPSLMYPSMDSLV